MVSSAKFSFTYINILYTDIYSEVAKILNYTCKPNKVTALNQLANSADMGRTY